MPSSKKQPSKSVLVVDDEPDVLEFLRLYLESLGWSVTTAPTTTEAFAAVLARPFFLIISDIAMPDMDGYEFMSRLRSMHLHARLAVMTGFGYNPNHTLVRIHRSLRYPCLFKPFNRTKLAETVQQAWNAYHHDLDSPATTPLP